jgi:hypothetical protein
MRKFFVDRASFVDHDMNKSVKLPTGITLEHFMGTVVPVLTKATSKFSKSSSKTSEGDKPLDLYICLIADEATLMTPLGF